MPGPLQQHPWADVQFRPESKNIRQRLIPVCHLVMSGPRGCIFASQDVGLLVVRTGRRWKLWRERDATVELCHTDDKETYSAICWATPEGDELKGHCVVAGCSSGRVQVWDSTSGEILSIAQAFHSLARGVDCSVSALVSIHRRISVFAACIGVPEILEIGLMDGLTRSSLRSGKIGMTTLAVAAGSADWLVAGGMASPLKVWCLPSAGADLGNLKKANQRLKGPASMPTSLDLCSSGGKIYVLCADGTTQVEFYHVGPDDSGHQGSQASSSTRVLSCHERIQRVWFGKHKSGDSDDFVALGYGESVVACWNFVANSNATMRTVTPTFAVSRPEFGGPVICMRGVETRRGSQMAVGTWDR
eukprot:s2488_g6.t2